MLQYESSSLGGIQPFVLEEASEGRDEGAAKRIGIRGGGGNSEGDACERADDADGSVGVGVILFSQPDSSVYSALPSLRSSVPPAALLRCLLAVCLHVCISLSFHIRERRRNMGIDAWGIWWCEENRYAYVARLSSTCRMQLMIDHIVFVQTAPKEAPEPSPSLH